MITAQTFFDDDRLPGCKLFRARLLAGNGSPGGAGATFASLDGKTDWQLVHGGRAEVGAAGGIDREDESVPGTVTRLLSLVGRWASPDRSRASAQRGRLDASLASSSLISHPISSSAAVASVAGAGRDNVRSRQRALQALGLLKGPASAAELEMGFGMKQRGPASLAALSRGLSLSSSLSVSEHSPLRVPVAVPREPRPFPPTPFASQNSRKTPIHSISDLTALLIEIQDTREMTKVCVTRARSKTAMLLSVAGCEDGCVGGREGND